jgi:ribose 1,5-bisphosphokinase PhnN
MLDFKVSLSNLLVSFRSLEIVVLPPNEETLRRRIANAGRSEREAAIIADYREHYAKHRLEKMASANAVVVVNLEGRVEETARGIHQEVLAARQAYGLEPGLSSL